MLVEILQSVILFIEELLIDFRELIGAHSGTNMAEVVWSTIVLYGLEGKVCELLRRYDHILI